MSKTSTTTLSKKKKKLENKFTYSHRFKHLLQESGNRSKDKEIDETHLLHQKKNKKIQIKQKNFKTAFQIKKKKNNENRQKKKPAAKT